MAVPFGPHFSVTPITNPTSTVLFKIFIALKSRNPIIIRPHGAVRICSCEAARICYEAALTAGAPNNCIQWVRRSSVQETLDFMGHKKTAMVLATGSMSLVRAVYRSGNPAIGVGPGNVPCCIGRSADVSFAVGQIFLSKTFDNWTVCSTSTTDNISVHHLLHLHRIARRKRDALIEDFNDEKLFDESYGLNERE